MRLLTLALLAALVAFSPRSHAYDDASCLGSDCNGGGGGSSDHTASSTTTLTNKTLDGGSIANNVPSTNTIRPRRHATNCSSLQTNAEVAAGEHCCDEDNGQCWQCVNPAAAGTSSAFCDNVADWVRTGFNDDLVTLSSVGINLNSAQILSFFDPFGGYFSKLDPTSGAASYYRLMVDGDPAATTDLYLGNSSLDAGANYAIFDTNLDTFAEWEAMLADLTGTAGSGTFLRGDGAWGDPTAYTPSLPGLWTDPDPTTFAGALDTLQSTKLDVTDALDADTVVRTNVTTLDNDYYWPTNSRGATGCFDDFLYGWGGTSTAVLFATTSTDPTTPGTFACTTAGDVIKYTGTNPDTLWRCTDAGTDTWVQIGETFNAHEVSACGFLVEAQATAVIGASAASDGAELARSAGTVSMSTGTSASTRANMFLAANRISSTQTLNTAQWNFEISGAYVAETRAIIAGHPTAGENWMVRFGWFDQPYNPSTAQTDAAYIGVYYDAANASHANEFFMETCSNSTCTRAYDTGTNTGTAAWHTLRIACSPTSCEFFDSGRLMGTINTNIPATGRSLGLGMFLEKSAGTTAKVVNMDYLAYYFARTTPRLKATP